MPLLSDHSGSPHSGACTSKETRSRVARLPPRSCCGCCGVQQSLQRQRIYPVLDNHATSLQTAVLVLAPPLLLFLTPILRCEINDAARHLIHCQSCGGRRRSQASCAQPPVPARLVSFLLPDIAQALAGELLQMLQAFALAAALHVCRAPRHSIKYQLQTIEPKNAHGREQTAQSCFLRWQFLPRTSVAFVAQSQHPSNPARLSARTRTALARSYD